MLVVSWLSLVMGLLVLPASLSRAGWLSLVVAVTCIAFREFGIKDYFWKHKLQAVSCVVLTILIGAGAFALKSESAWGRLHIWRMECLSIAEKPLTGHGPGKVLGAYGDAQAKFFREKERSEKEKQIASCPEYAFNEYLKVGVEYGMPAMLAFLSWVGLVVSSLLKKNSPLAYGAIAMAIFAFFSYPLSLWQFKGLAVLFLASAVPEKGSWKLLSIGAVVASFAFLVFLMIKKPGPREDEYKLTYEQGYSLHQSGRFEESNRTLLEGAEISSDPMFHNIIGKNYEALGDYEGAEREYIHAHFMVPCRLYPLVLLMEMELKRANRTTALEYGNKALLLPVNNRNLAMRELHLRVKSCVDTLLVK